jgi:hypothetical protein
MVERTKALDNLLQPTSLNCSFQHFIEQVMCITTPLTASSCPGVLLDVGTRVGTGDGRMVGDSCVWMAEDANGSPAHRWGSAKESHEDRPLAAQDMPLFGHPCAWVLFVLEETCMSGLFSILSMILYDR